MHAQNQGCRGNGTVQYPCHRTMEGGVGNREEGIIDRMRGRSSKHATCDLPPASWILYATLMVVASYLFLFPNVIAFLIAPNGKQPSKQGCCMFSSPGHKHLLSHICHMTFICCFSFLPLSAALISNLMHPDLTSRTSCRGLIVKVGVSEHQN